MFPSVRQACVLQNVFDPAPAWVAVGNFGPQRFFVLGVLPGAAQRRPARAGQQLVSMVIDRFSWFGAVVRLAVPIKMVGALVVLFCVGLTLIGSPRR